MSSRALTFLKPGPRQATNQQELLHLQVMPAFFVTFLIVMNNTPFLPFGDITYIQTAGAYELMVWRDLSLICHTECIDTGPCRGCHREVPRDTGTRRGILRGIRSHTTGF